MIPAWYFCACIKADPGQASAWLAVLDTLDIGESEERSRCGADRISRSPCTTRTCSGSACTA